MNEDSRPYPGRREPVVGVSRCQGWSKLPRDAATVKALSCGIASAGCSRYRAGVCWHPSRPLPQGSGETRWYRESRVCALFALVGRKALFVCANFAFRHMQSSDTVGRRAIMAKRNAKTAKLRATPHGPTRAYDVGAVEARWRTRWEESGIYRARLVGAERPFYNLMMFPYPSAEGLHVGNMYAFIGSDG